MSTGAAELGGGSLDMIRPTKVLVWPQYQLTLPIFLTVDFISFSCAWPVQKQANVSVVTPF